MSRIHSRSEKRAAFTLIELMVVVLIIAILVSLVSSAVVMAMGKIPETQTRTEISQMEQALGAFMADYNLSTSPPSTLVLNESAPLTGPSAAFLQQVFGRNLGANGTAVDWNGDGQLNGPWALEGEQCLVFYLGGIGGTQGFSTNNINPATAGGKRKGPYFTFQTSRLIPGNLLNLPPSGHPPNALNAFPVYLDAWKSKAAPQIAPYDNGTPYAYFSSQGNNNGYTSDCPTIDLAGPYGTGTAYMNSNTYQIISAGKDGTFGGGTWNPSGGTTGASADDQANFSSKLLGVGQQ